MSAVVERCLPLVRPMVETDIDQIVDIESQCYEFPWSADVFTDCLRVGYCCWVMETDALIGGYGIMMVGYRDAHILNICVREDLRGLGHGRALLDNLLQVASRHRAEIVLLEVRPSNSAAIGLYEHAGFSQIGVRRAYYPARDGREDALVLTRSLTPRLTPR